VDPEVPALPALLDPVPGWVDPVVADPVLDDNDDPLLTDPGAVPTVPDGDVPVTPDGVEPDVPPPSVLDGDVPLAMPAGAEPDDVPPFSNPDWEVVLVAAGADPPRLPEGAIRELELLTELAGARVAVPPSDIGIRSACAGDPPVSVSAMASRPALVNAPRRAGLDTVGVCFMCVVFLSDGHTALANGAGCKSHGRQDDHQTVRAIAHICACGRCVMVFSARACTAGHAACRPGLT